MTNGVYNSVEMIGSQREINRFMKIGMDIDNSGRKMFNFHNFFLNLNVKVDGKYYNELTEDFQNKIWSEYIQTSNGFSFSYNKKDKSMEYESKWYPSAGFYILFGSIFDITFKIGCSDLYDQDWMYIIYKGKILDREFLQCDEGSDEFILRDDFMVYKENKFEVDDCCEYNLISN